jgi:hypothetical protein
MSNSVNVMRLIHSAITVLLGSALSLIPTGSARAAFTLTLGQGTSTSSNTPPTGASGTIKFTFTQDVNFVKLEMLITNTTGQAIFGDGATVSKLTGFAFDLIDGVTVGNAEVGQFLDVYFADPVDFQPFDPLDNAFGDNDNFLGGNPQGALSQGQSDTLRLFLSTAKTAAQVEQEFFIGFQQASLGYALRFQNVNAGEGSDKLLGTGGDDGVVKDKAIPWQADMVSAGSLLFLGGLVYHRYRQRQRSA